MREQQYTATRTGTRPPIDQLGEWTPHESLTPERFHGYALWRREVEVAEETPRTRAQLREDERAVAALEQALVGKLPPSLTPLDLLLPFLESAARDHHGNPRPGIGLAALRSEDAVRLRPRTHGVNASEIIEDGDDDPADDAPLNAEPWLYLLGIRTAATLPLHREDQAERRSRTEADPTLALAILARAVTAPLTHLAEAHQRHRALIEAELVALRTLSSFDRAAQIAPLVARWLLSAAPSPVEFAITSGILAGIDYGATITPRRLTVTELMQEVADLCSVRARDLEPARGTFTAILDGLQDDHASHPALARWEADPRTSVQRETLRKAIDKKLRLIEDAERALDAHRREADPLPLVEALTAALRTRRLPSEREADAKSGARFWLGLSERLNALGAGLIGEPDPIWRAIERRRGALTDARRLSAEMRKLRRAGTQGEAEDLEPTDDELREIDAERE
jgi:hypothetical protein